MVIHIQPFQGFEVLERWKRSIGVTTDCIRRKCDILRCTRIFYIKHDTKISIKSYNENPIYSRFE